MRTAPTRPRLDRSHPLAEQLICYCVGQGELVNQKTLSATGVVMADSPHGSAPMSTVQSSAAAIDTGVRTPANWSGGLTYALAAYRASGVTINDAPLAGNRAGGGGSPLQFVKFTDGGEWYSNGVIASYGTWAAGAAANLAFSWDGATLFSYRDGAIRQTASFSTVMSSLPIWMFGDTPAGEFGAAGVVLPAFAVWTRGLSSGELDQFFADPFAMARPRGTRRRTAPAAAAPAGGAFVWGGFGGF